VSQRTMEWSAIAHNTNAADCLDKRLHCAQSRLCRAFATFRESQPFRIPSSKLFRCTLPLMSAEHGRPRRNEYYLEQGMKSALLEQKRLEQTSSLLYSFHKLGSYSTCVLQNSFAHSQVMPSCPSGSTGKSQPPLVYLFWSICK